MTSNKVVGERINLLTTVEVQVLCGLEQGQKLGGARFSSIALLVLAVTIPTMRSVMPPACLSRGWVNSILYLRSAMKRSIVSDLYPVPGSMRIYRELRGSGCAWSNTRQVKLRFHNSLNDLIMSSAALDLIKLQYIICDALFMRSQYLNPLIDRWVQQKASIGKLCPGTVGRGL